MEYVLNAPISKKMVADLRVGDVIYLNGTIIGMRDATQKRIFVDGVEPPVDLREQVILHTAPNAKKIGDRWSKICIGTTTSARMEKYAHKLIEKYGVSAIVGKGGLLEGSLNAMKKFGATYFAIVGGAAALETTQIEEIEEVYWEDLFPECLWVFRVKNFGPLIVAMDSHGNSIYKRVYSEARSKLPKIVENTLKEGLVVGNNST
jgi:L(+)-tartrate dehydratase beta subunit